MAVRAMSNDEMYRERGNLYSIQIVYPCKSTAARGNAKLRERDWLEPINLKWSTLSIPKKNYVIKKLSDR